MNAEMNRRLAAFERVDQFLTDHTITPANARVTALIALVKATIAEMKDHRNDQDSGGSKASDGTDERALVADRLRRLMRKIAKLAKELDPTEFPGVRNALRLPRNSSYPALEARAETFLANIATVKAAMIARGLSADFDEQLQGLLTDFTAATQRQSTGRADRVSGTAGLGPASSLGLGYVRELDGILFAIYDGNPALYAAWKSASRVERAPRRAKESTAPTGVTGGSGGTTASSGAGGGGGGTPTPPPGTPAPATAG
jgi:hypothetical protein